MSHRRDPLLDRRLSRRALLGAGAGLFAAAFALRTDRLGATAAFARTSPVQLPHANPACQCGCRGRSETPGQSRLA
jgi:hypothetical protein